MKHMLKLSGVLNFGVVYGVCIDISSLNYTDV